MTEMTRRRSVDFRMICGLLHRNLNTNKNSKEEINIQPVLGTTHQEQKHEVRRTWLEDALANAAYEKQHDTDCLVGMNAPLELGAIVLVVRVERVTTK